MALDGLMGKDAKKQAEVAVYTDGKKRWDEYEDYSARIQELRDEVEEKLKELNAIDREYGVRIGQLEAEQADIRNRLYNLRRSRWGR
jgi:DNA repair ATPase RecN